MIVYFKDMRKKDDKKEEALYRATIKLVNKIGFASASVSKIAKEAGVSPATLYVYFKNKDDLITSTYVAIKKEISSAILTDFDNNNPVRDILQIAWQNLFTYASINREAFQFTEQFSYSPYSQQVNKQEVESYFAPILLVIESGIKQKILKDIPHDVISAFLLYPAMILANPNLCRNFEVNDKNIEIAFQAAWDAIKM